MIKPSDVPEVIPLFPLHGALLLPRARLPLCIFETRYLAMIDACLKTSTRLIGMIQTRTSPPDEAQLYTIGCAGRLTSFSELEDGRYMITLSGFSRFELLNEVEGFTPYRRAAVQWQPFAQDVCREEETDATFDRTSFLALFKRYLTTMKLATDWSSIESAQTELLISAASMLCPFEAQDKQALLEAPTLTERRKTLVTLLEFALRGGTADGMRQ